jgi:hypothetical protein
MLTTSWMKIKVNNRIRQTNVFSGVNMSIKLGEMLIEAGLLTRSQLDAALKNQVIFGGRLGTNLLELGFLAEEDLACFLSKKLELPCATNEQLKSVSPDVIKLIPKEVADKYKVVPLGRERKRLFLAMLDPADLSVIDAISFVTGFYISPLIAPELRLAVALEHYYGIKRDVRYIQLSEKGERRPSFVKLDEIIETTVKEHEVFEPEVFDFSLPQEDEEMIDIIDVQEVMESAVEPVTMEPVTMEPVNTEPEKSEPEVAEPVIKAPVMHTLESVAEELVEAKDREEIAEIISAFLGQEFNRVVIFMIKGTIVEGWKGLLNNRPIPDIKNLQIPLDESSVLKVVNDGRSFYLGPIPDTPGNARLLAGIGGGAPSTALLIPLSIMGRVVAIIYVDGGKERVANRLTDLQKLVGKTGMAFEILILKNKILMT